VARDSSSGDCAIDHATASSVRLAAATGRRSPCTSDKTMTKQLDGPVDVAVVIGDQRIASVRTLPFIA
jgi:hypothetical protein